MADLFLQIGSLWLIFVPYGTTGGCHMAAVVDICLMWLIFVPFGK